MSDRILLPTLPIDPIDETPTRPRRRTLLVVLIACLVTAGCIFGGISWFNQPVYVAPQHFTVTEGESAKRVAERLSDAGLIRSDLFFYVNLVLFHDPTAIKASTYVLDTALTTTELIVRLTTGDFDADLLRLTVIEGERAALIAERAKAVLPEFDTVAFAAAAAEYEGELFPDTYFIPATYTAPELLTLLTQTFTEKTESLQATLQSHPLGKQGVLTLASIVEREANTETSKKMVAGILLNRLEIQMPLQTDASIEYVLDTPLGELPPGELATLLETLDSPYNTYRYSGLPPTPIGNPGLTAIKAVLEPTPSDYFYYITGNDGEFYYARTYDAHLDNIATYLR